MKTRRKIIVRKGRLIEPEDAKEIFYTVLSLPLTIIGIILALILGFGLEEIFENILPTHH